MIIFIEELGMLFFLWCLKLIEGMTSLFSSLIGTQSVLFEGEEWTLQDLCFSNGTVTQVFFCIFIGSCGLTLLFTIFSIIKHTVDMKEGLLSILGKTGKTILLLFVVTAGIYCGLSIMQDLTRMVLGFFETSGVHTSIAKALFDSCCPNFINGYSIYELDLSSVTVRDLVGSYEETYLGFWPATYKYDGMINPDTFLYLPALISSVILVFSMLQTILTLAKRLYELLLLYLLVPVSLAVTPLDDGNSFNTWKQQFISRVLLSFGALLSMDLFLLLLPYLGAVEIESLGWLDNQLFTLLLLCGGALFLPSGMRLTAFLFTNERGHEEHLGPYISKVLHQMNHTTNEAVKLIGKGIAALIRKIAEKAKQKKKEKEDRMRFAPPTIITTEGSAWEPPVLKPLPMDDSPKQEQSEGGDPFASDTEVP